MKVLLINPPQTFPKDALATIEQLPLGLMYVASFLKKHNFEVQILDALRTKDQLTSFDNYEYYGLTLEEIIDYVKRFSPDVVGISNPFSYQIKNSIHVARAIKDYDGKIITVLGGAHPTLEPIELMQKELAIDYCVQGEGEIVFYNLLQTLANSSDQFANISGICYRKNGEVILNPKASFIDDLDNLPFPAYDLIPLENYLSKPYKLKPRTPDTTRVIEMITSRGCPFDCVFCSIHATMGKKFRAHSSSYVLDHIEHVISNYKVEHIRFNDDNFSMNMKRFERILDGIIDRKLKFSWDCPNGIRADALNENLLRKMKQAGCQHIFVAAESGSQRILDEVIGKKIKLSEIEETLRLAKKVKLSTDVYFIMGLPGEDKQTLQETLSLGIYFQKKYRANPYFFVAMPLPGTKLKEICEANSYIRDDFKTSSLSATSKEAIIETKEFSRDDVNQMISRANRMSARIRKFQNFTLLFREPSAFLQKLSRRF